MTTATDAYMRMNVRRMRAEVLADFILRTLSPYIQDDDLVYAAHTLIKALAGAGVEVVDDAMRRHLGLPARGPDGWTAEEIRALDVARMAVILRPVEPVWPKAPNADEQSCRKD